VKLTLFIFNGILKNEMWHPVCDELWFIVCYLYVGKTGCYTSSSSLAFIVNDKDKDKPPNFLKFY